MIARAAVAVIATLLAAAAAWHVAPEVAAAWPALGSVPGPAWALALGGMACSHLLRAARLRCEWRDRARLRFVDALRITLVHSATVNLLPARLGELGYPLMLQKGWGVPLTESTTSLVWMRLQDAAVLAWLASLTALTFAHVRGVLGTAVTGACVVLVTAAWLQAVHASAGLSRRLRLPAETRTRRQRLQSLLVRAAARASAAASNESWFWCAANWVVKLLSLGALLHAMTRVGWLGGWAGALGGEVAAALPVQPPAGFGTYEAGVAFATTVAVASTPPMALLLAASVVMHLTVLGVSCAGALATGRPVGGLSRRSLALTPEHQTRRVAP